MGNTRENETVAGSANDVYATQGGYGPGPELSEKKGLDPELKESETRQEAQKTIASDDSIESSEGEK